MNKKIKKILVTGSAGFIGFSLCVKLLDRNVNIVGIDNNNDYYDPKVKEARFVRLSKYSNYQHWPFSPLLILLMLFFVCLPLGGFCW